MALNKAGIDCNIIDYLVRKNLYLINTLTRQMNKMHFFVHIESIFIRIAWRQFYEFFDKCSKILIWWTQKKSPSNQKDIYHLRILAKNLTNFFHRLSLWFIFLDFRKIRLWFFFLQKMSSNWSKICIALQKCCQTLPNFFTFIVWFFLQYYF